jgi:deoxyribodipyrimidine photo-lyase
MNKNFLEKYNRRVRLLKEGRSEGRILYWLSREQRIHDNHSLIFAQDLSLQYSQALFVLFTLTDDFLHANLRHYSFMLQGLQCLSEELRKKNIPFFVLYGDPAKNVIKFISENNIGSLVTDFDPLRIKRNWKQKVIDHTNIDIYEVDAHNVVPCWVTSEKKEWAAYTIRPKINKKVPLYLKEFSKIIKSPFASKATSLENDILSLLDKLKINRSVGKVDWIKSSEKEAIKKMHHFIDNKLGDYNMRRNDPVLDGQSNLSPYLHFGQICAQRIILETLKKDTDKNSKDAFIEEILIRKELSDNFCYYEKDYDNIGSLPNWAYDSLISHVHDKRPYLYNMDDLENAATHDDLWNAAQKEMVKRAKMHGYMRMYWAKKILEWTPSIEEAIFIAIYLNDKYELDGRDPNGYTGIMWSLGGIHDRAFAPRPVFGKLRYMSYKSLNTKFKVKEYINYANML